MDADDTTIAAAHRALARRHHPDVAGETATARMMAINAAFDAIRTAERRTAYDALLPPAVQARRSTPATGGAASDPMAARERLRWRPVNDGTGKAGPPPGRPSGSVLAFGRHKDWSIGEIARMDPGYLAWLEERPEGRPYLDEIDAVLRRIGYRSDGTGGGRTNGQTRGTTAKRPSHTRRRMFRRS
jgi:curved DNA-binding protein CbpA